MVRRLEIAFLVTTALAVVLQAAGGVDGDRGATATLRVEQPVLDLGEVVAGTDVVARFVFHNDGGQDLRIVRAKPS